MVKLTDRRIAWFVREAAKGRETPQTWAPIWGVTVRRLQQLVKQYKDTRQLPTLDPNRRPRKPPLTPAEQALIDRTYRKHATGATEVWRRLGRAGHTISHQQVYRHMRARGWVEPNPRKQKPRRRCRYERDHAGSLLHGDWHRTTWDHPHVILWLDDATRRILSGGEFPEATSDHAIATFDAALKEAARWGLRVEQANTDRGPQFYANKIDGRTPGTSRFEAHLTRLKIQHIPSRPHNPQTNGKLERLWLEYDRHRWRFATLDQYIRWTNDRPHSALAHQTPNEAWIPKLPTETLLRLHLRLAEGQPRRFTAEALYAK